MRILYCGESAADSGPILSALTPECPECSLVCVESEPALLAALNDGQNDVILSDLSLPSAGEMRLLQAARRERPEVPFLFFTSAPAEDWAVECIRQGAADFVPKHRPERLAPAVRRAMREAGDLQADRRSQAPARKAEAMFRLIAETITEVFWMSDRNVDHTFYISPGYERIWGRSREYLMRNPKSYLDAVHPEDLPALLASYEPKQSGKPFDHEYRIIRPDGSVRWIWDRGFPVAGDGAFAGAYVGVAQDITARKQAEQNLLASSRQYRQIVDLAAEGICVLDAAGLITFANGQMARLLEYQPDELLGRRLTDFMSPEVRAMAEEKLGSRQWRISQRHESRFRTRTGGPLWAFLSCAPLSGTEGHHEGTLAMVTDVTVLKNAETMERASRERLEFALKSIEAGIWEMDLHGRSAFRSALHGRIFGYEPPLPPWSFARFLEHVLPADREFVRQSVGGALASGADYSFECRIARTDGAVRWVLVHAHQVRNSEGRAERVIGIIRDITERKQNEESLREISQLNAQIISNAREGIVVYGPDLRYQVWNDYMERLTGVPAKDVIGRHPLEVFPTLAGMGVQDRIEAALRGEAFGELEGPFEIEQTGHKGWASDLSGPLRNSKGEIVGVIATVREISERKRVEEEKARLEEELRQSQKLESIGQLAGGVAHDFNNLLTVILGNCDILLARMTDGSAAHRAAQGIERAAEHAADLTRQLLAFGRKQIVQPRLVDLSRIVSECEGMLRRLVGEEIGLTTVLAPWLPPVNVDPGQVQQILINLAANSRDAIPGNGVIRIETRLAGGGLPAGVPAELACGGVVLSVSDNGAGMNDETLQRLFEPFYTTKELGRGTGLGLSTVFGIVQQAGGWIGVESEPGKGSIFTVVFPPAGLEEGPIAPTRPAEPWMEQGDETLLLLEDDAELRWLTAEVLKTLGYSVLEAATGDEAERLAESHPGPIHLLLSDVVLTQATGREVARRVESRRPGIAVLFMSGYSAEMVASRGVQEDAPDYLAKPFKAVELAHRVRAALDRRTA